MSNKHHKENNQLSLMLEFGSRASEALSADRVARSPVASVITFPGRQVSSSPSFRERVIQDLMRNRVMVGD